MRKLTGFWRHVVTALSVMLVLFQLYTAGFGVFPDIVQRSVHLFFVLTMLFLLMPANKKKKTDTVPWYDVVLSMICMVCTGYMILIYEKILWDPSQWINSFDKICAVLLTILILEGSRRAVGLTATVAKTSAGALNYTPVAKVTNLTATMEDLKKKGMWFVCADMGGELMYRLNLKGPIGLVVGNEGEGVGKLVKEHCDMVASIPMKGDIDSLNASVAAGVLAYEIVRQRLS